MERVVIQCEDHLVAWHLKREVKLSNIIRMQSPAFMLKPQFVTSDNRFDLIQYHQQSVFIDRVAVNMDSDRPYCRSVLSQRYHKVIQNGGDKT